MRYLGKVVGVNASRGFKSPSHRHIIKNTMKVRVIKKSQNENSYRTPLEQIDGMPNKPIVGSGLLLTSSVHESGGIFTSNVDSFEEHDWGYLVKTKFSEYKIEVVQ